MHRVDDILNLMIDHIFQPNNCKIMMLPMGQVFIQFTTLRLLSTATQAL